MISISFSWDDGAVEDLVLLKLLNKYRVPAMFFIPARNDERPVIHPNDVLLLCREGHEIGAHTFNHKYLNCIPMSKVELEIKDGKNYLEDIIAKPVNYFCYPGGKFTPEVSSIAAKYFDSSRTAQTMNFSSQTCHNRKTTFHFYNRGWQSVLKNLLQNDPLMLPNIAPLLQFDYFDIIKRSIAKLSVTQEMHYIHIWGHSWEIAQQGLWGELEKLFRFINKNHSASLKKYDDIFALPNSQ